jgi:hypothetical protein
MALVTQAPIQVPLINGVVYSFGHITLDIAGLEFTGGFKSIKYSRKRTREMVRSNSPDPVGKTLGENEYQASAEVYLAWWQALMNTIQNTLGVGYGDQPFNVFVKYNANGFSPIVDTIINCTFDTTDADQSTGPGALVRPVEFNPTKILFNGLDDLANPLVSANQ